MLPDPGDEVSSHPLHEPQAICAEGKTFPVECQFCDTVYSFTPNDIRELLKNV